MVELMTDSHAQVRCCYNDTLMHRSGNQESHVRTHFKTLKIPLHKFPSCSHFYAIDCLYLNFLCPSLFPRNPLPRIPSVVVSIPRLLQHLRMDNLPPELLTQILQQVPKTSLQSCRLVSHRISALAFPLLFSHILKWFDYNISKRSAISLAHDAHMRPAVIWSPWATGPEGPVDEIWMRIVWKVLMGTSFADGVEKGVELTEDNFARLSGREEMSKNRLRMGQNRYLLYRAYTEDRNDAKYMEGKVF